MGKKKKYKLKEDVNLYGAITFSSHKKSGYTRYVMAFSGKTTPSIIAHEAVHIVNHIYFDRKIDLDLINDEPQAYLLGWIVQKCHKFLKLNK